MTPPRNHALDEDVDWKRVMREAASRAPRHLSKSDVDEAIAIGVAKIVDGKPPWNPAEGPLSRLVIGVGINAVRDDARRRGRHDEFDERRVDERADGPDVVHADAARKDRFVRDLRAACAPDELRLLEAIEQGIRGLGAQMAHFRRDELWVRNLRKRLFRKSDALLENEDRPSEP